MSAATVAATEPYDYVLSPISPVSPALPFAAEAINSDGNHPMRDCHFTVVFNHSGQPAASIICDYSKDHMPIGLQIVGRRFDDVGVLRMARLFESMRPAPMPWPQPEPEAVDRSGACTSL